LQNRQTVDVLFHLGPFANALAVALFYLTVVLKKGQVVDRGFTGDRTFTSIPTCTVSSPAAAYRPITNDGCPAAGNICCP
jgi:hypothetical protein